MVNKISIFLVIFTGIMMITATISNNSTINIIDQSFATNSTSADEASAVTGIDTSLKKPMDEKKLDLSTTGGENSGERQKLCPLPGEYYDKIAKKCSINPGTGGKNSGVQGPNCATGYHVEGNTCVKDPIPYSCSNPVPSVKNKNIKACPGTSSSTPFATNNLIPTPDSCPTGEYYNKTTKQCILICDYVPPGSGPSSETKYPRCEDVMKG
jgi:hypothetical protein